MRYTARKILTLLVTMLVVSLLTFAAFDMISGDPAATLLGTQATPEKVEALRTEMGLNRPMLVRYGEWLAGFFTGNLGVSFQYRQPVQKVLDTRRAAPLSAAAMETLAIIAYNQPVSRSFIEQVRGVDSSSSVSNLLEKGLIEEAGRLDLPGRPVSFRTTDVFLRCFGLSGLADLPDPHGGASGLPLEQLAATGSLPADTQPPEEV